MLLHNYDNMAGHVTHMGEMRNAYRIMESPKVNIKMEFKEMGCEDVDCFYLAEGRN
jgi:hypothetical protein